MIYRLPNFTSEIEAEEFRKQAYLSKLVCSDPAEKEIIDTAIHYSIESVYFLSATLDKANIQSSMSLLKNRFKSLVRDFKQ